MASTSYNINVNFDNFFGDIFSDMEKERKNRIKKLEKIRERRYLDHKSVRKIGAKGDFSYLDEYGKRLEEDMATFKELNRQREEQENNWLSRPLSPLPPLFPISPDQSPKMTYRLIGNDDYMTSRIAQMEEMGLHGVMQEYYGGEFNPYSVTGPEGAAIAAERLSQINERIAKLKIRATEIQEGIQEHMGEEDQGSAEEIIDAADSGPIQAQYLVDDTPEIRITQEEEENDDDKSNEN